MSIEKEEFANELGISIKRFDELTDTIDEILYPDILWSEIINKTVKVSNDPLECIILGICLGRIMQQDLCASCEDVVKTIDPKMN